MLLFFVLTQNHDETLIIQHDPKSKAHDYSSENLQGRRNMHEQTMSHECLSPSGPVWLELDLSLNCAWIVDENTAAIKIPQIIAKERRLLSTELSSHAFQPQRSKLMDPRCPRNELSPASVWRGKL